MKILTYETAKNEGAQEALNEFKSKIKKMLKADPFAKKLDSYELYTLVEELKRTEFKKKPPKKKTRKEKNPKGWWKDEADKWFSRFIRKSSADWKGEATCVTCGAVMKWEDLQCGHYESRGTHILRYSEKNCHCQCVGCNVFKKGNMTRYATFMVKAYGAGILEELEEISKQKIQRTAKDYQEIAEKYKKLFDALR